MSYIGLISDTHDHLEKVRAAVAIINQFNLKMVIHCGDIVAPFVLNEMKHLNAPLHIVFGNCDGDREILKERARGYGFEIADGPVEIGGENRKIIVTHKPIESVPECDFYIHGHTHKIRYERRSSVIVNPGEACGWLTGKATIAILNINNGEAKFINL